jgi:dGTPase
LRGEINGLPLGKRLNPIGAAIIMMEWEKLLTRQRLGKNTPDDAVTARTSFQKDYDRLVFSSPFRRLKDKTQVFSLSKNDYIRTRLIHSLEVSCVGRSLGTIVGYEIKHRHNLSEFSAGDFGDIVATACLAHDIGNPPFGHAGEDALRSAFETWDNTEKARLNPLEKADFDLFEGNAQGFRILTKLEIPARNGGMQLTCPTLAAFTKYPKESLIGADILNGYSGKSVAKYGFFQSEKDLFNQIADTVGLIRRYPETGWWARHPLAFLVEAADDICYHIVDFEDGYRLGHIPFTKTQELLNEIAQQSKSHLEQQANTEEEKIKYLRARVINTMVQEVADIFLEHEQSLLAGIFDQELISMSQYAHILQSIQQETQNKVFNSPEVVGVLIGGYEVLGSLFAEFIQAAFCSSKKGNLINYLLPPEYRSAENESSYSKILKINDYISGMTDSYATNLFQKIKGISLG